MDNEQAQALPDRKTYKSLRSHKAVMDLVSALPDEPLEQGPFAFDYAHHLVNGHREPNPVNYGPLPLSMALVLRGRVRAALGR